MEAAVLREFEGVLQEAGSDPLAFILRCSHISTCIGREQLQLVVSVTWLPGGVSCTYWNSQYTTWLSEFRQDVRSGRFSSRIFGVPGAPSTASEFRGRAPVSSSVRPPMERKASRSPTAPRHPRSDVPAPP